MLPPVLSGIVWPILYLLCFLFLVSQWNCLLVWTPLRFLSCEGGTWDFLSKVSIDLSFTVSVALQKKDEGSMYPMGIER